MYRCSSLISSGPIAIFNIGHFLGRVALAVPLEVAPLLEVALLLKFALLARVVLVLPWNSSVCAFTRCSPRSRCFSQSG